MAPRTPLSAPQASARSNKYSKQTLHITVGRAKDSFHVHYSQLERTAFFEVEGRPKSRESGAQSYEDLNTQREHTISPGPVKAEDGAETRTYRPEDNADQGIFTESPSLPVYHLEGFVYHPAAFEIVINWLYNQNPDKPRARTECKTLLRAYVLALQYKIVQLQDSLIDCFRKYHQEFSVTFEDLVWLINRVGEGPEAHSIPMLKYLVDQIAFELYTQGYRSFVNNNAFFETFLTQGDRPVRKVLFEAMTETSRLTPPIDPATGPHRWRVQDWAHPQDTTPAPVDFIDIDD